MNATSLAIARYELWTDSQTVQKWCASDTLELRAFERNRVDAILKRTNGKQPRYVPTGENPADIATRGCRIDETEKWNFWLNGPQFLSECGNLQIVHFLPEEQCAASFQAFQKAPENAEIQFMKHALSRTNELTRALQIVRKVIECYNKWKLRALKTNTITDTTQSVNRKARLALIRAAQNERFDKILKAMKVGTSFEDAIAKQHAADPALRYLVNYILFLDRDSILRIGGRIDYASNLTEEAKHPAILPSDHQITKLFILDRHKAMAHRAAEWVLASLSSDVGLRPVGGIKTVRSYLKDCFTCKLLHAKRSEQLMAPLPDYRIQPRQAVFSSVSIDYAGPYEVKRGRSVNKRWACLFVCNVTSAVRIEIVESLETIAFVAALRRFLCLTGNQTRLIRSDCASTFIGAKNLMARELKQVLVNTSKSPDVQKTLQDAEIKWSFSTPLGSHHQGTVERQIRTFKEVCQGVLGPDNRQRNPTDFELQTIFREAEYIMNCRPLGKCIGDQNDILPLRPIDLMTGFLEPTNLLDHKNTSPTDELRRGIAYTRRLVEEWWQKWINQYSFSLQRRQKWTSVKRNLQIGDLVLLIDSTTPPVGRYPYAVVIQVKECKDGRVRSATVRTSDGRVRERDIRQLVLIEEANLDNQNNELDGPNLNQVAYIENANNDEIDTRRQSEFSDNSIYDDEIQSTSTSFCYDRSDQLNNFWCWPLTRKSGEESFSYFCMLQLLRLSHTMCANFFLSQKIWGDCNDSRLSLLVLV